jgi:hypothetical protein
MSSGGKPRDRGANNNLDYDNPFYYLPPSRPLHNNSNYYKQCYDTEFGSPCQEYCCNNTTLAIVWRLDLVCGT